MNKMNAKKKGGLVLNTKDLLKIINEPDTVGIAFGVKKPGKSKNVDLLVYKVFQLGGEYVGDIRKVSKKSGAANVNSTLSDVASFYFEYAKDLEKSGFDFAYLKKEEFHRITRKGTLHEVYISGGINDYGSGGCIEGEYFTLKIEPKKTVNLKESNNIDAKESLKSLGNEPDTYFMPPCPPFWTKNFDPIESGNENNGRIVFNENNLVNKS